MTKIRPYWFYTYGIIIGGICALTPFWLDIIILTIASVIAFYFEDFKIMKPKGPHEKNHNDNPPKLDFA